MSDIKRQIKDTIKEALANGPDDTTYWVTLDKVDGNTWAVVFGWVDGFEDGEHLCGKIAYAPTNSAMAEYDIDWLMPYDEETGDVWDTEISDPDDFDIDWWLKEWEAIKKELVYKDDIESSSTVEIDDKKAITAYSSYDDLLDNWKEELDQRWDTMDDEERAEYNNDYFEYLDAMAGISFTEEDFRQPMDRSSQYYDIRVGRGDPMYLSDEEWKKLEHYFHHEIYDEIAAESVYQFLQDKLDELPDAPW